MYFVGILSPEHADELLDFLHNKGWTWHGGAPLTQTNYWNFYGIETVYELDETAKCVALCNRDWVFDEMEPMPIHGFYTCMQEIAKINVDNGEIVCYNEYKSKK